MRFIFLVPLLMAVLNIPFIVHWKALSALSLFSFGFSCAGAGYCFALNNYQPWMIKRLGRNLFAGAVGLTMCLLPGAGWAESYEITDASGYPIGQVRRRETTSYAPAAEAGLAGGLNGFLAGYLASQPGPGPVSGQSSQDQALYVLLNTKACPTCLELYSQEADYCPQDGSPLRPSLDVAQESGLL